MNWAGMSLTQEADDDRADFMRDCEGRGCLCFISPPCSLCTHPGNPRNQDECDECWELDDFAARIEDRLEKLRATLHESIDRKIAA